MSLFMFALMTLRSSNGKGTKFLLGEVGLEYPGPIRGFEASLLSSMASPSSSVDAKLLLLQSKQCNNL